ncbi:MAG: glutathione S-transferase family protein [Elsteraceae bacterium]
MGAGVTLFGAAYSVYVRSARLTLEEKGVPYLLEETDIFGADRENRSALKRQPFGKIPAFDHDGFALYETAAINRYVDEAFDGPPLQPQEPQRRARMTQAISILDAYVYRSLVWGVYMHDPAAGPAALAAAVATSRLALSELAAIMGEADWLAGGEAISLADLHAYPMFRYAVMKPEGEALLRESRLRAWFDRIAARPSARATLFPKEQAE